MLLSEKGYSIEEYNNKIEIVIPPLIETTNNTFSIPEERKKKLSEDELHIILSLVEHFYETDNK